MYGYCELRTTWPPRLVLSVLEYGEGGLGSIPWWAHILQCLFLLLFSRFYAELLHTSYMEL